MRVERLSIDLSNYCSKQCSFCYNHSTREGNTLWKVDEVISFATDCVLNGVKSVSLGGGEPFEYEGIFDVIDALQPIVYLSVTSNGLPLLDEKIMHRLSEHKPYKVHITIHQPYNKVEVERVVSQVQQLGKIGIKPGINIMVSKETIDVCGEVYGMARRTLSPEQIILVPRRYVSTPTAKELASVAYGEPFQGPTCLLGCNPLQRFVSVSWDKRANHCSYAREKGALQTLDYKGLVEAINSVGGCSCL